MLYFEAVEELAKSVYDNLHIPEDIYKTFDLASATDFKNTYLSNTSYLQAMVADELYDRDDLDIDPQHQTDLIEDVVDEVSDMIEFNLKKYQEYQHTATIFEYRIILQILQDYAARSLSSVTDISTEEYGDPIITLTLDNGATITMNVSFEEEYDNI